VFIDECGIGSQIVQRLEEEDQDVIVVTAGKGWGKLNERIFTINPRRRDDYDKLLVELRRLDKTPDRIVHLWSIRLGHLKLQQSDAVLDVALELFYGLIFLVQALGTDDPKTVHHIDIVSNNLHKVAGDEELLPEIATLLSLCKIVPQEYPNVTVRSIDVTIPSVKRRRDELIDLLVAELAIKSPDAIIAYRGDRRWIQVYEAIEVEQRTRGRPMLREGGACGITGG